MKKQVLLVVVSVFCLLIAQLGVPRFSNGQSATNPKNDFGGVNHGDFIALVWNDAEGAAQYYVYTSTSLAGPWTLSFSVGDNLGGAKLDYTPDARLRDVCYKVEATDTSGFVIRLYEPICVPKYAA